MQDVELRDVLGASAGCLSVIAEVTAYWASPSYPHEAPPVEAMGGLAEMAQGMADRCKAEARS